MNKRIFLLVGLLALFLSSLSACAEQSSLTTGNVDTPMWRFSLSYDNPTEKPFSETGVSIASPIKVAQNNAVLTLTVSGSYMLSEKGYYNWLDDIDDPNTPIPESGFSRAPAVLPDYVRGEVQACIMVSNCFDSGDTQTCLNEKMDVINTCLNNNVAQNDFVSDIQIDTITVTVNDK